MMCLNSNFGWRHNLPFFSLGPWVSMVLGRNWQILYFSNINFDDNYDLKGLFLSFRKIIKSLD